jgi:hypothetical protein
VGTKAAARGDPAPGRYEWAKFANDGGAYLVL